MKIAPNKLKKINNNNNNKKTIKMICMFVSASYVLVKYKFEFKQFLELNLGCWLQMSKK